MIGGDDDHDAVEHEPGGVPPRGHPVWVGDAAQFDDDMVGRGVTCSELVERCAEAVDETATHASIGELHGVAVTARNQRCIDVDLADVVDQDGDRAIGHRQELVDRGGLTRTEISGDEGDRHATTVPRKKLRLLVRHCC